MAHVLVHTCTSHPYEIEPEEDTEEESDDQPEPLLTWTVEQWSGVLESFECLRKVLIRKDAKMNYIRPSDVGKNAGTVDSELATAPWFKKKFKVMEEQITIHRILAPIREALEAQVRRTGKEKAIKKKDLDDVRHQIDSLGEESAVKEALLTLFHRQEDDSGNKFLHLKGLNELRDVLADLPFNLCHFQYSVESCMHRLNQFLAKGKDCALIQARYTIPKASELHRTLAPNIDARVAASSARRRQNANALEKAKLNELRRGRAALKTGHGDDPLDAAVEAAQGAKPSADQEDGERPRESDKNKRKRVPRLTIVDEMEEDDDDDANETAAGLSQVPRRKRRSAVGGEEPPPGPPPDEGIFDENGKVLKRLKWTDEEKACVKEGVKVYGVGKWVSIKTDYAEILRNRTPVQIKDCWRTMTKNQEV